MGVRLLGRERSKGLRPFETFVSPLYLLVGSDMNIGEDGRGRPIPPRFWKTVGELGSPRLYLQGARTVAWANQARILQGWAGKEENIS